MESRAKTALRWLTGLLFIGAGANHFFHAAFYRAIMPPSIPWPGACVALSGVAEIGLGFLLFFRRWQIWAAWGLVALLVAVFPVHVYMAFYAALFPQYNPTLLWLRIPFQLVLMGWVTWVGGITTTRSKSPR